MAQNILKPRQALNKAFLKVKPNRAEMPRKENNNTKAFQELVLYY